MSLYLKYRPQDFDSLVGQEFIKSTLQAAVSSSKTVGAYIFTGPRGTGKTSTARIFAKAINCENLKEGNPCNTCNICKEFSQNSLIDIIEIDAASHTGVDNIREIIEKAQFRPTLTEYKIYIIDEVHMLSKGAFNALLKILEEPPSHVKFILATTEIHKVPNTILSRCQRFDFRNHTDTDVRERLKYIAKKESVSVDDESYDYIVKSAGGGLRDAISLFEQLISNNTISFSYVTKTLGIVETDQQNAFIEKLISKDASLLDDLDTLYSSGKNIKNFLKETLYILQKHSIDDLQAGKEIGSKIEILEDLQDMLMKSKNSFDEMLTFRVGFLKILSGVSGTSISPTEKKSDQQISPPIEKKEKISNKKPPEEDTNNSLLQQAEDVFSDNSPFQDLGGAKVPEQGFNITNLIEETKKAGAKAALIMSLKGANISIDRDSLVIVSQTKIAHGAISKPESKEYILSACDALHLGIVSVTVT